MKLSSSRLGGRTIKQDPPAAPSQQRDAASEPASLDTLPLDVLHRVFDKVAEQEGGHKLARLGLVNREWRECADHPQPWQAAAKALRLPTCAPDARRKQVERACVVDRNMRTGGPIIVREIEHFGWVYALQFSSDGSKLATGSDDGTVFLTDVNSGEALATIQAQRQVRGLSFSPDGSKLAMKLKGAALLLDYASGARSE